VELRVKRTIVNLHSPKFAAEKYTATQASLGTSCCVSRNVTAMAGRKKILKKTETKNIAVEVWHPNDSYSLTLKQIREQLTPAGLYRQKLATTGKAERALRRLEWRWERRLPKWIKSATAVQAGYRGMVGRRYFKSIKTELEIKRAQREAKIAAIEAFKIGDKEQTIKILSMVEQMTGELYIVKAKVLYTTKQYDQCIECALAALSTSAMEFEARFLLANCYVQKNEMLSAFDELNLLAIAGDQRFDSRRLRACVATRLDPPNYDDSLLVLESLIDEYPEDLNLVSDYSTHPICLPRSLNQPTASAAGERLLLPTGLPSSHYRLFEYPPLPKGSRDGATPPVLTLPSHICLPDWTD
jgi:tetratricopeptide (TPR) repeat protein